MVARTHMPSLLRRCIATAMLMLLLLAPAAHAQDAPPAPPPEPATGQQSTPAPQSSSTRYREPVDRFGRPCRSERQEGCIRNDPKGRIPVVVVLIGIGAFVLLMVGLALLGRRQRRNDPDAAVRAEAITALIEQRFGGTADGDAPGGVAPVRSRRVDPHHEFREEPRFRNQGGSGIDVNGIRLFGRGGLVAHVKRIKDDVAPIPGQLRGVVDEATQAAQQWDGSSEVASQVVSDLVGSDQVLDHTVQVSAPGLLVVQLGGAALEGAPGGDRNVHVAVATGGQWISNTYQTRSTPLVLQVQPGTYQLRLAIADAAPAQLDVRIGIRAANAA
jgi:hypothetical protein